MKYIANPVIVDAFKIVFVERGDCDNSRRIILENNDVVYATPEMISRMEPIVKDYWVIQPDGYVYLNPKDVFEKKYSPYKEL